MLTMMLFGNAIVCPVGGGGLISGIGARLKQSFPAVKIIGVEPLESASMYESLKRSAPFTLDRVGTFADGVAVRRVGDETFRVAREVVDDIILVSTDEICAAIKDVFEDTRSVLEPAGALALGLGHGVAVAQIEAQRLAVAGRFEEGRHR